MTNTTSRKPTTARRLNATTPLLDAVADSPFSHPLQVKEALELARRDVLDSEVPDRLSDTVTELVQRGLVEEYMSTRGGRGRFVLRVRLSEEGKARLARASRAALLVVNGLL